MSWFDSSGLAGFAKTALTNAQKKIDKVLDIEELESSNAASSSPSAAKATSASTSASAVAKPSSRPSRVPSSGGGAFAAYGAYVPPTAPTTPSINRDAGAESETSEQPEDGNNDWGNQSSLWSSWFDFGGKKQGSEGSIEGSGDDNEDGGGSGESGLDPVESPNVKKDDKKLKPIVAAQPPRVVETKSDVGISNQESTKPLKLDVDGNENTDSSHKTPSATESTEPSKYRDNDLKRSGSLRARKSRDSIEAKRAKPAAPKKLGQRVGEMKITDASRNADDEVEDVASSRNDDSEEVSTSQNVLDDAVKEGSSLDVDIPSSEKGLAMRDGGDMAVNVGSLPSGSAVAASAVSFIGTDSSLTNPSRDAGENPLESSYKLNDVTPLIPASNNVGLDRLTSLTSSTTSFDGGTNSLSASACWEVKEGDAEVEAILRKHEAEMEIVSVTSDVNSVASDVNSVISEDSVQTIKLTAESSPNAISSESSSQVISSKSSSQVISSKSSSQVILTSQPTFTPLSVVTASKEMASSADQLDVEQQQQQQSDAVGVSSAMSLEKTASVSSFLSSSVKSSTSTTSLSSFAASSTSLSEQTIIQQSESDLSSFNLSQQSLSTTKLTDSSTTEGTLGPDEEQELDAEITPETQLIDFANAETRLIDDVVDAEATATLEPMMSTSATSIASNVVKDLLGDAMTESLTLPMTPPRKTSENSEISTESAADVESAKQDAVASAGTVDDDSYDDDEDAGGSISDCGKGYNSSDEIPTGCTTSDEREETATSSDIEIISNPSIMDGDVNDRRFEVTSPLRSFGPLPISEASQDVIFHHQSLRHGFHQRTPSQSSSCSSSANVDKKKTFLDWNELKVDTRDGAAGESDSPFESPNFGDSENEAKDLKEATLKRKPKPESVTEEKEIEKSAGSVRQRLMEETGGGGVGGEDAGGGHGGGRRTPRMSRSRKSSERHLSTATLTASSEDKRDVDDEDSGDAAAHTSSKDAVTKQLLKKMKDMSEVIQAREVNAFDLSKMNAELTETVTLLRQQVANAVAGRESTGQEMDQMKEEFGRRLADSENKLRSTAQDRDAVKRELNQALKDVQSKAALEAIVKEKEDLVQELMDEGRKLSLQLGNANTALRKLRAKEKEGEGVSQRRKEKGEAAEKRVEELEAALEEAVKREKTKSSRVEQLEEKINILESIKFEAESQMEDDQAKMESLKVSLEAANQEISSMQSRLIEADSLVAEAEGKAERNAVKAMEREFEMAQETLIAEREALAAALEDLRVHVSRQERDMGRREDVLKQELSALQFRLQEADERNDQLVESMGGATLPLLRQIENLKLTMNNQAASWEAVEVNLNDRLLESQMHLIASEEKERVVSEELFELRGRLTAETSKASSFSTEKTLLKIELETLKMKLTAAEEAKSAKALQTSSVKTALSQEINELKIVKLDLESQVEFLGSKVVELERRHRSVSPPPSPRRSSTPRPFSPPLVLTTHSSTASFGTISGAASVGAIHAHPAPSLYSVVRDSGASFQTEEMQSQLKQKDGEICQLQTDIMNLELTRESMASELVELANKNTTLEESIKHYPLLKKQHADMEVQYNALLQMFGEKAEEYDELRMDLEHVKTMYKQQIEELVQKDSFRR